MQDEDLALLDRWCEGDRDAGNALFKRHFAALYRLFTYKVNTNSDVDDLVQSTFLACVKDRQHFRRQSTFRTYLFAIARNVLRRYWQRTSKCEDMIDFDQLSIASLSTSIRGRLTSRDDHARLLDALRELSLEQQLLLELYYWEEISRDQLAEVFEIAPATIGSRLFRAREELQQRLDASTEKPVEPVTSAHNFDAWVRALRPAGEKIRNVALDIGTNKT